MKEVTWRDSAACLRGNPYPWMHDPDAFFERPEDDPGGPRLNADAVKAFRRRCWSHCLVREQCLNEVMAFEGTANRNGRYGIWGGLTPGERADRADVAARQEAS